MAKIYVLGVGRRLGLALADNALCKNIASLHADV